MRDWHPNDGTDPPPIGKWLAICIKRDGRIVRTGGAWVYAITGAGPDWNETTFIPTHWRLP